MKLANSPPRANLDFNSINEALGYDSKDTLALKHTGDEESYGTLASCWYLLDWFLFSPMSDSVGEPFGGTVLRPPNSPVF